MSLPVCSEHPTAATAVDAPTTLRKSRRLTGVLVWSFILIVAVGAVVARLLSVRGQRRRGLRARLRRVVAGRLEAFRRAVAVDVTAHAPTHVERRVLIDLIHLLDLAVTGLASDAGVDV